MAEIILDDSPEAAHKETREYWISRNGRAYNDERAARYDGCTHRRCDECKEPTDKFRIKCPTCRAKQLKEMYLRMPFKEWDGKEPLCLHDSDEFFWGEEDIEFFCDTNDLKPEDLDLVICEPLMAREVDPMDIYGDCLPEEGDLPDELEEAFKELNEKIRAYKTPLSWHAGKFRTSYKGSV